MSLSLAEMRHKLKEMQENKNKGNSNNFIGDKSVYPHWNAPVGSTTQVRFLPDANTNNPFFWVDRMMIKMPFNGVLNETDKEVFVQVPCMTMYGKKCPISKAIAPWWNGSEEEKQMAHKYWRKKTTIYHGFVRSSAFEEETVPENPIRKFYITDKIVKIVMDGLDDLEHLPTDIKNGTDFLIKSYQDGQYKQWTTSKYARSETPLSMEEAEAVDKYGVPDMSTYLPKEPTEEELDVIMRMFNDSVNGEAFNMDEYGAYYKPMNYKSGDKNNSKDEHEDFKPAIQVKKVAVKKVSTHADEEVPLSAYEEESSNSSLDDDAEFLNETMAEQPVQQPAKKVDVRDLLAKLNRNKKQA